MPSYADVPIRVMANNIPRRAPSPLLFHTTLPEFGDGGHTHSTIGTPTSTTTELGHPGTSPLVTPDTSDFLIDPDNSPPARPPSPVLPQSNFPVTLATCHSPLPTGVMKIGIKCWSCDVYNSITVPTSLNHPEVCPLFPFLYFPMAFNQPLGFIVPHVTLSCRSHSYIALVYIALLILNQQRFVIFFEKNGFSPPS